LRAANDLRKRTASSLSERKSYAPLGHVSTSVSGILQDA